MRNEFVDPRGERRWRSTCPPFVLKTRRRELLREVQGKMRDARSDNTKEHDVFDQGEISEVDIQEEIEFALIQMKAETLNKIDAALRRIEDGTYGDCFDCGDGITVVKVRPAFVAHLEHAKSLRTSLSTQN